MPSLTIEHFPEDLYAILTDSAKLHRRSLDGEAIACLKHALSEKKLDVEAFLERADEIRNSLNVSPLTEEFMRDAREWGRP